jgi:predicted nucleic acid-binding protein
MGIPDRVLLDTNIVNFILDWGEAIHDGGELPSHVNDRDMGDIFALREIWPTGHRASWQLAVSPFTYEEVAATPNPIRRAALEDWFRELWLYWREFFEQCELSDLDADSLARRLVPSGILAALSDCSDRVLLAHAIAYECDAMCTRDRKTILRHRDKLGLGPVRILTPTEWWPQFRSKQACVTDRSYKRHFIAGPSRVQP